MRKIFIAYIAAWCVLLLLSPAPQPAFASNPTVTITKTTALRAHYYAISIPFAVSLSDTAFIYNENSSWFSIDGVCAHPSDSLITLECYSSETTADSVRYAIMWQVSTKASPTVTAATLPSADWTIALTDSVTLNNKTPGMTPGISKFSKLRLAGQATKMRIVIYELNTTNPVKDATQTLTLRLAIPRR